jgi:hypothetical protein
MRQIARVHHVRDEFIWDLAGLHENLLEIYVEGRCKNHQRSILAMSRDLVAGMQQIIAAHDLQDEVIWAIADVFANLFTTHVERQREDQVPPRRSAHPTMVELLAWLDRLGTDHDDDADAALAAAD